jgi:LytS/YehU family sensor histidine kinase
VGGSLAALIAVTAIEAGLNVVLIPPDWMLRFIVVGGCFNIGIGFFFGAYHKLQMDAELKQRKLAETAARAQAYALQAQIAPHFFFNTLNSISALISADPVAAQKMIGGLADVFRYTFASSRMEVVPFDRELEFVRDYLSIEKIRYRDRLQFHLPEEGQTDGLALPGLTLQPLVENAIRHGISHRIEGGTIRVDLQPDGDFICISVWNQFDIADGTPNFSESEIFKPGHALANTRDRLRLAFGKDAKIEFSVMNTDWVRVMVFVPWKGKATHASTGH